jgi:hypothetical protein
MSFINGTFNELTFCKEDGNKCDPSFTEFHKISESRCFCFLKVFLFLDRSLQIDFVSKGAKGAQQFA